MYINLHDFLDRSTENGPGTRAVIWVQGCSLHCPGCFNPDTHDIKIRHLVSVDGLAQRILSISGIEGITISGGEPFLQAASLAELGAIMQRENLGVIVFSGFLFDHLKQAQNPFWDALLAVTDLLIAGPFIRERVWERSLRGSSNQTLHYLSDRYRSIQEKLEQRTNRVEILIDSSGQIIVTGFSDFIY